MRTSLARNSYYSHSFWINIQFTKRIYFSSSNVFYLWWSLFITVNFNLFAMKHLFMQLSPDMSPLSTYVLFVPLDIALQLLLYLRWKSVIKMLCPPLDRQTDRQTDILMEQAGDVNLGSAYYTVCFHGFPSFTIHPEIKHTQEPFLALTTYLCIYSFYFRIDELHWGYPKKHTVCV